MAKDKKGLGTGLDILFGGGEADDSSELLHLPIGKVEPRADQPRGYFDEEALRDLADSIAQYGLIQPILVRKLDSGYYQIIAGERRWRASRLAGLAEVPVRVIEADDRRVAELALVENLQREDLNPIEEARGYRSLMDDFGLSQEETAHSVGRSRPAIANALRLLTLAPPVMELVERGELSAGHARALVSIPSAARQLEAAQLVMKKALSVRKTELLVGKIVNETSSSTPDAHGEDLVDYAAELSNELSALLGRKVQLVENRRGGRLELYFYGPEDRETLIDALRRGFQKS